MIIDSETTTVSKKKKRKVFNDILRVEIIGCKNYSTLVDSPFNKESNNRVSAQIGLRDLILG